MQLNLTKNGTNSTENGGSAIRADFYFGRGHQVIVQGIIGGKISKYDTVNVDLWYSGAYELYRSGWNLIELAKMSDIFHKHVNVQF